MIFTILGAIWSHPWGRAVIIGGGLFLWGVTKGWVWAMAGRDAAIAKAEADLNVHWQETIKKSNQEHEYALQQAVESADAVRPARDREHLVKLCRNPKTNSDCRDKDLYRVQSIQKDNMVGP